MLFHWHNLEWNQGILNVKWLRTWFRCSCHQVWVHWFFFCPATFYLIQLSLVIKTTTSHSKSVPGILLTCIDYRSIFSQSRRTLRKNSRTQKWQNENTYRRRRVRCIPVASLACCSSGRGKPLRLPLFLFFLILRSGEKFLIPSLVPNPCFQQP